MIVMKSIYAVGCSIVLVFLLLQHETFTLYNLNSKIKLTVNDMNGASPSNLGTQLERKSRLREFCSKYLKQKNFLKHDRTSYSKNYIYSNEEKVIYCYVPKAACTTWKRLFQLFEGNEENLNNVTNKDEIHDMSYNQISRLPATKQKYYFTAYYTFMFTRHPFDRLFATYRNKFLHPFNNTYYKDTYSHLIFKAFRPTLPKTAYNNTTITFLEFVKYILTEPGYIDQHWAPMYQVCKLCRYKFDYLGKHETLVEDAENVLQELDISHKYKFPKQKYDYKKKTTDLLKKYYEQIPKYILKDLYEYYRIDFEAFGYDFEEYIK